jgi:hypothetical protein
VEFLRNVLKKFLWNDFKKDEERVEGGGDI